MPSLALGGLQRWMQAVIVHPAERTREALASSEAAALVPPERLGDVVLTLPAIRAIRAPRSPKKRANRRALPSPTWPTSSPYLSI